MTSGMDSPDSLGLKSPRFDGLALLIPSVWLDATLRGDSEGLGPELNLVDVHCPLVLHDANGTGLTLPLQAVACLRIPVKMPAVAPAPTAAPQIP